MTELFWLGLHLVKSQRSRRTLCGCPTGPIKARAIVAEVGHCAGCVSRAGKLLERKPRVPSQLEELFAAAMPRELEELAAGVAREYEFGACLARKWRFDFAWPDQRIAVELDGGSYLPMSRHGSGPGRDDEVIRDAAATLLGWRVFRVTRAVLKSGACWSWLRHALVGGPTFNLAGSMFPKPSELRPKRVRAATVRA